MLLDVNKSILLVIDVQARLLPGVQQSKELVRNCRWLVTLADLAEVPVLGSEQYPDGLGHTEESLRELVGLEHIYGKHHFSCIDDPGFAEAFEKRDRQQVILCGMESQACIMQSTMRLLEKGLDVYVVADAISARNEWDTEIALRRMEQAGAKLVTREMVGFEWIRRSDSALFKAFSKDYLR